VRWIAVSLVLSVVLTVVLNVALRAFPGASNRLARGIDELASKEEDDPRGEGQVRVVVPWKAMLIGSLILTFLLNLLLWVL
jgi:hypothetical protein